MSQISVVVGGQFGSEAKGHVAARIAAEDRKLGNRHVAVRVAGPNAGHTAYDKTGHRFAFRQLPVAAVTNPHAELVIAAGSEVELAVLQHEVELAERLGHQVRHRLWIDPQATVITEAHKQAEVFGELQKKLGSTQKGIGAARADRLMRKTALVGDQQNVDDFNRLGIVHRTGGLMAELLKDGAHVLVEGTQGYGLGLHAGFYPQCTSSDCTAVDFLSMAGLSPWQADSCSVLVVCRVYPIRVAGNSGPLANETTWAALKLPEEHTTVTKKIRRVGGWDLDLVKRAVAANGGPAPQVKLVITMIDQKYPALAGLDGSINDHVTAIKESGAGEWLDEVAGELATPVVAIGTGPTTMVLV